MSSSRRSFMVPPPQWWNTHGFKMALVPDPHRADQLVLKTNVASLVITHLNGDKWLLEWNIVSDVGQTGGCVTCTTATLRAAFRLGSVVTNEELDLFKKLKKLRLTRATSGIFIRKGPFLSIPSQGTGMDGDPNLSVFVSDEIRDAMALLTNITE